MDLHKTSHKLGLHNFLQLEPVPDNSLRNTVSTNGVVYLIDYCFGHKLLINTVKSITYSNLASYPDLYIVGKDLGPNFISLSDFL